MDNILRDKNENVSSGQLVHMSNKNDTEMSSPENLKENHNPKSLLEIAADTTSLFHLDASTPKNGKKSGSYKDISFQLKVNDSYSNSSGLSFLANGLNNLNLKGGDVSDDQFLSFNDVSNHETDQSLDEKDEKLNTNDTLIIENNERVSKDIEDISKEDVETPTIINEESTIPESTDINVVSETRHTESHTTEKQVEESQEIQIKDNFVPAINEKVVNDESFSIAKDQTIDVAQENSAVSHNNSPQMPEASNASSNLNTTNNIEETSSNSISGNVTQILNEKDQNELLSPKSQMEENVVDLHSNNREQDEVVFENTNVNKSVQLVDVPQNIMLAENPVLNTTFDDHLLLKENLIKLSEQQVSSNNDGLNIDEVSMEKSAHQLIDTSNENKQVNNDVPINTTFEEPKMEYLDAQLSQPTADEKESDFSDFSNIDDLRNLTRRTSLGTLDFQSQHASSAVEVQKLSNSFDMNPKGFNQNFMEFLQPSLDIEFKKPTAQISRKSSNNKNENDFNDEFTSAASYNFGNSDFDFLQKFGSNSSDQNFGRDSVLLKFDPLFSKPVPQLSPKIPEVIEEEVHSIKVKEDYSQLEAEESTQSENITSPIIDENPQLVTDFDKDMEIMKDIVAENEKQISNIDCEDIKLSSIDHHENQSNKFMESENKLRMEAEQREEVLLKRISEKDKQISKMNNVVKEYEKAIAELIAEKEQLVQSYEKKCADLKNDSEMNAQHLASLESTFSDLHAKYERTKQIASDLKDKEEHILQDRKTLMDNLKMQEARYEKMKMHAMSQLEIANNKLAEMLRNHQAEVTKLKAQLKKEEISRASINEQLIQKSKENAELVKICDELIGNHGNSQAV